MAPSPRARFALAAVATALAAAVLTVAPALAHGHMHCNAVQGGPAEVGFGRFDPIVSPGVEPAGHEHMFFNNAEILAAGQRANATYAAMTGNGQGNCENPGDKAIYWVPSIFQKWFDAQGPHWTRLRAHAGIFYYRPWSWPKKRANQGTSPAPSNAQPPDLRVVAGDPTATAAQPTNVVNWTCNVGSSRPGPYTSAVQAACDTATGSTVRLGFHIDFPSCWDGQLNSHAGPGNTADFTDRTGDGVADHLARVGGTSTDPTCPAGFGQRLNSIRYAIQLDDRFGNDYRGNGQDLYLSTSAGDDGTFGTPDDAPVTAQQSQWTLHGDFWNTWIQGTPGSTGSTLNGMVTRCLNTSSAHPHGSSVVCGAT